MCDGTETENGRSHTWRKSKRSACHVEGENEASSVIFRILSRYLLTLLIYNVLRNRMGLVQRFMVTWMFSAQLVVSFPSGEMTLHDSNSRGCKMCPAGEYLKSCTKCKPCPTGSYTTGWNQENECSRCSGDCSADFHLKVVQNCTHESDVKCVCEDGFRCIQKVPYSENCRYCEKIQGTSSDETTAVTSDKDKGLSSPVSQRHSSTSAKPCRFPTCGPQSVLAAENNTHPQTGKTSSQLLTTLTCLVFVMGCMTLVFMFCVRRAGDKSCFKQAKSLLACNKGARDASHKSEESTHQFPRDSFSAKQQPLPLSEANLGPVHVHNPGTVIFSLLSQFTGQVGPTINGGKTAMRGSVEDEDDRDCGVFHPTSSPTVRISEEERSQETDSIFFPSQEQGKDCCVSKEEVL